MTKRLLVSSILVGLAATFSAHGVFAQSADTNQSTPDADKDKKKDSTQLEEVVVTGSLIPRAQVETASPIITITAKDLELHAYRNVYDALHTMPIATGSVQDGQAAGQGSFAPGATTVSLFGLSPSFTLTLLNGHPMADYPAPYNGIETITDLSTIPIELVDHIDILSGGQSSLYGSSAVAGVINIVLKKKLDGTDVDFRVGGYNNGGGSDERFQISGGHTWGDISAVYSLSLENQEPVRLSQTFFGSRLDNPLGGSIAGRDFLQLFPFSGGAYVDPGAAACQQSSKLFGGTLQYSQRAGFGNYCGSLNDLGGTTVVNGNKSANGYLNLTDRLNDHVELYSEVLYSFSKQLIGNTSQWAYANPELNQSANSFSSVFWDNTAQNFEQAQRLFAPEEMGNIDTNAEKLYTRQYNVNIGARGGFGDWNYDLFYNRSQINTFDTQRWPLTQPFTDYYLGAQQGTDPYGYGFPAYTPNTDHFYKPLTPAQFDAMTDFVNSRSLTWEQNVHLTVSNTDLFQMPAGAVGAAVIAEIGNQAFNRPVDSRVTAGEFNNLTGNQGGGSRRRYAVGGEIQVPLLSTLSADLSARYDSYSYDGRTDSKPTYKLGLEYRPIDTLLLRANYATAFRAPDMLYIFQGPSGLYDPSANDYFQCRSAGFSGANLSNCPDANIGVFNFYHGSPDLKDITAKTFGYGVVWSPTANFDVKVDFNHIAISNEVEVLSSDSILKTEADCRLGVSEGGQAFDINSALCQSTLAQVHRYPADFPFVFAQNELQYISNYPINIADENLSGIQASSTYRMDWGKYGNLALSAQYYIELKHLVRQDPGDPFQDVLHDYLSYENKSRSSASVSWAIDKLTATLYGTLYGKTVAYNAPATFGRWAQFNGSLQYDFDTRSTMLFTVNNLFNRAPPRDPSVAGGNQVPPPYYNYYVYNGLGRIYWAELKFHF